MWSFCWVVVWTKLMTIGSIMLRCETNQNLEYDTLKIVELFDMMHEDENKIEKTLGWQIADDTEHLNL